MQSVVGIIPSLAWAEQAVEGLLGGGMTQHSIIFLSADLPDRGGTRSAEQKLETIPTTDADSDGMGKAMGAAVGGAVGAGAGLAGGAAVASLLVPGVGTVFAVGLGAAAALGLGGAAAGAKAGGRQRARARCGSSERRCAVLSRLAAAGPLAGHCECGYRGTSRNCTVRVQAAG
jgi:hypothetical protein